MSQFSMMPWETRTGTGDGAASYTQQQANNFFRYFDVGDPASEGVCRRVLNELEVSGTTSPLSVATGAAVCYGRFWSDAAEQLAVTTPSVGDTGGRVVLRADWSANQIRLAVKLNTDGDDTIPSLTQNAGTTWEIGLASFVIDTSGNIWFDANKSLAGVNDTRIFRFQFTQNVVVPVVSATNQTDGNIFIPHTNQGVELPALKDSFAYGIWTVPTDYVPGTEILINHLMVANANGDVALFPIQAFGAIGGTLSNNQNFYAGLTLTQDQLVADAQSVLTEDEIGAGDLMYLYLQRAAASQSPFDDMGDTLEFYGFRVTYESAP